MGAGILAVVPTVVVAFLLLPGGPLRKGSTLALPETEAPAVSTGGPEEPEPAEEGQKEDEQSEMSPLRSLPWDVPERLEDAMQFVLARGDRETAMRLLGRMAPDSEAYEQTLSRLNRRFVDAWHAAVATAARACLEEDRTLDAAAREGLEALLPACAVGRERLAALPASAGGIRAVLLILHARSEFLRAIDDCPEAYAEVLASRTLASFPGASSLLGTAPSRPSWDAPRAGMVHHLRARVILPVLCGRLAALREAARGAAAVEAWLTGVMADGRRWREYLIGPGGEAEQRAALGLVPVVLRRSWQRDACLTLLARQGVRELLAGEKLLDAVWPGESSGEEVEELVRLVVAAPDCQQALRSLDYAVAERVAEDAVGLLLGGNRADVGGQIRAGFETERLAFSAKPFPWYRVMRSLKVRDTPVFWQGHASLAPGELAHLQSGTRQIQEIPPEAVGECLLRHARRLPDAQARRHALEGVQAFLHNRGLTGKQGRN